LLVEVQFYRLNDFEIQLNKTMQVKIKNDVNQEVALLNEKLITLAEQNELLNKSLEASLAKLEEVRIQVSNLKADNELKDAHLIEKDTQHVECQVKVNDLAQQIKMKELNLEDCLIELQKLPALFTGAGTLLNIMQQMKLNEFYGVPNQPWQLLYKATRDGFSASIFHQLCDDKGATISVIKSSEGWLFGGFTTQSWSGNGVNKADPQAFLFTLTNPHNIPATKFITIQQQCAIHGHQGSGPIFGGCGGNDIHVNTNSNINTHSNTDFPNLYKDTTGKAQSTLFTGSRHFSTTDIEIYTIMM